MGANFKAGGTEDVTPVPQHEFTRTNELHLFPFNDIFPPALDCPDCDAVCHPDNLGEAVDWALGHECAEPGEDDGTPDHNGPNWGVR